MIIDCHQHTDWHGRRTADLVKYLDQAGVDKAWLLSWEAIDGGREMSYMHLSIEQVFAAAAAYPGRFIIGAGVDGRRENAPRLLRDYHKAGARVYGEIKLRALMDTPELIVMFRLAGELGMPVVFHLDLPRIGPEGVCAWYLGDIDAVERTLAKCPATVFLAHGPGWWTHISGGVKGAEDTYPKGPVQPGGEVIRLLDKYSNLYCDLSAGSGYNALTRDGPFGRKFLIDYSERVLYGVDFFDTRLLDHLRKLDLPAEVLGRILSGNAIRLVPV